MKLWQLSLVISCAISAVATAQVQPLDDAPDVLRLASGGEVEVLRMFKTTFIETDEPCLVLCYPTTKTKDALLTEVEEVFVAFKPFVEKERVGAAVIYQTTRANHGGYTSIRKRDVNGTWDRLKRDDKGITPNGLDGTDLVQVTQRANAIVRLRLIFDPKIVTDPEYPNVKQQVIQSVVVMQTLKKNAELLGEAALRQACAAWQPGEKWISPGPTNYVDYFVFEVLPVGDFGNGAYQHEGRYLVPVTQDISHFVERALNSQPAAQY
jgi:hypothetical protein